MSDRLLTIFGIALGFIGAGVLAVHPGATTGWLLIVVGAFLLGHVWRQQKTEQRSVAPQPGRLVALEQPKQPVLQASPVVLRGDRSPAASPPSQVPVGFVTQSPKELVEIYRQHTKIQADQLWKSFEGKPIQVTGTLSNCSDHGDQLMLFMQDGDHTDIFASFGMDWKGSLEHLPKNHRVAVQGTIEKIEIGSLCLNNCRLIG